MKIPTTRVLSLAFALVLAWATPALSQEHAGHQHADEDHPTGMMHPMMQQCPMAGGSMMGGMMAPESLLTQAEELELTDEQIDELEGLVERSAELHAAMREMMGAMHEVLTSEQMELMHERHGEGMMRGMDHGGMRGAMGEGMMGDGAMHCPMMQPDGDEPETHPHSR